MGTVFKRDSNWYVNTVVNGKRIRRKIGPNKREAQSVLRELEKQVSEGVVPTSAKTESPLFKDAAELYIASKAKGNVRTFKTVKAVFKGHLCPFFGEMELAEITPQDVLRFIESRKDMGYAAKTVQMHYRCLKTAFTSFVFMEFVSASPVVLPRQHTPSNEDRSVDWRSQAIYQPNEVACILDAQKHCAHLSGVFHMLFYTGMRIGEVIGLKFCDIIKADGLNKLSVRRSHDGPTKTKRPRVVPVHPALEKVLNYWTREGWERRYGRSPEKDDYVFPARQSPNMLHTEVVRHVLLRSLAKLNLRRRRVHDTRRTFISTAISKGGNRDAVKAITHGSSGDILGLYTTLPWEALCEVVLLVPDFSQNLCESGVLECLQA